MNDTDVIIVAAVCGVGGLIIVLLCIAWCLWRKRNKEQFLNEQAEKDKRLMLHLRSQGAGAHRANQGQTSHINPAFSHIGMAPAGQQHNWKWMPTELEPEQSAAFKIFAQPKVQKKLDRAQSVPPVTNPKQPLQRQRSVPVPPVTIMVNDTDYLIPPSPPAQRSAIVPPAAKPPPPPPPPPPVAPAPPTMPPAVLPIYKIKTLPSSPKQNTKQWPKASSSPEGSTNDTSPDQQDVPKAHETSPKSTVDAPPKQPPIPKVHKAPAPKIPAPPPPPPHPIELGGSPKPPRKKLHPIEMGGMPIPPRRQAPKPPVKYHSPSQQSSKSDTPLNQSNPPKCEDTVIQCDEEDEVMRPRLEHADMKIDLTMFDPVEPMAPPIFSPVIMIPKKSDQDLSREAEERVEELFKDIFTVHGTRYTTSESEDGLESPTRKTPIYEQNWDKLNNTQPAQAAGSDQGKKKKKKKKK